MMMFLDSKIRADFSNLPIFPLRLALSNNRNLNIISNIISINFLLDQNGRVRNSNKIFPFDFSIFRSKRFQKLKLNLFIFLPNFFTWTYILE